MIVKLHDKEFKPFISEQELQNKVKQLAQNLSGEMKGKTPIFVCVLNGAAIFACDFVKNYSGDCELSFVKLSSYSGLSSTNSVKELLGLTVNVENRDVVVLEDIVDTGNTLEVIYDIFKEKNVASLTIVSLFFKPEAYTKKLKVHHIGFEIPNKFIVGYGLDYNELGRNLPQIYELNS